MYPKPLALCCTYKFPTSFTKLFCALLYKNIPISPVCCPSYCTPNWIRKLNCMGPFMCSVCLWFSVNKNNK